MTIRGQEGLPIDVLNFRVGEDFLVVTPVQSDVGPEVELVANGPNTQVYLNGSHKPPVHTTIIQRGIRYFDIFFDNDPTLSV